MKNDFLDYNYDNCYYLNPTFKNDNNDITLNEFLESNFTKKNLNINNLNECKDEARTKKKDFFLVGNLKNDNNTNLLNYDCYIPNKDSDCDFSNISNFVNPFNSILKKLLGSNTNRKKVSNNYIFELSSNDFSDYSNIEKLKIKNTKCYHYNNDTNDMYYGNNKSDNEAYFALYKTDLIDNENINNILKTPKINNMYMNFDEHNSNYINNFKKDDFNSLLNKVRASFSNYLCNKDKSSLSNLKEREFDKSLTDLGNYYNTMFSNINDLSKDISNLHIITKYDLYRLKHLDEKIKTEKKTLSDLLKFDGASNGKLFDTKYLKNIKLSETIILSLIIVFIIYFYAKKK